MMQTLTQFLLVFSLLSLLSALLVFFACFICNLLFKFRCLGLKSIIKYTVYDIGFFIWGILWLIVLTQYQIISHDESVNIAWYLFFSLPVICGILSVLSENEEVI